jgi:Polysaccharide lyase
MKNTWHIITQWHQGLDTSTCLRNGGRVDCNPVPLGFNLRDYNNDGNPTLELVVINKENGDGFDRLWQRELTQQDHDIWHEFRLHVKWSACDLFDPTNGRCKAENDGAFVEFWFDGKKQQLNMPTTPFYNMDEDKVVYMKQGLYHCRLSTGCPYSSSDRPLSIYHDGMEYTVWSDIVSRIKITSLNRINGQDRILTPMYQVTQTSLTGQPDWKIFHYIWKENQQHSDVEAIMGLVPSSDGGYVVEIGKLTQLGIRIDIDNGSRTITIPATNWNQVGSGFVAFEIPG